MTSGQKTALSVLITVILTGGICVLAFTELFSVIDSRFYEPAKISKINDKLEAISTCYDEYIKTLDARFATGESAYLKNASVASFVDSRPSNDDAKKRSELTGTLRSTTQGLMGIRVVDKNLNSIHYSTFRDDVLRENLEENIIIYKNYNEVTSELGNKEIAMTDLAAQDTNGNLSKGAQTYFDGKDGRIIFSYPFYDKYFVFRGTILFYVNADDFSRTLVKRNLLGVGSPFDFIADKNAHGFALGIPSIAHEDFIEPILNAWKENQTSAQKLFAIENSDSKNQNYWIMITSLAGKDTFVSEIFNDEILALPLSGRILILVCACISIFLIVFLILNLRRDDMTVIRERIVRLQLGVVDEYLKRKSDLNVQTISGKREAVTREILHSLGRRGRLHRKEVEELINRSWDELLSAMGIQPKQAQTAAFSAESTEEIKNMLQEILSSGNIKVQAVGGVSPSVSAKPARPVAVEEAEPLEAEELDEVESLDDADELDEVEELGDAEELEEVEILDEAEPVEEVEALEEVEELDDAEIVEEAEVVDELDDLGQIDSLDDIEPIDNVDSSVTAGSDDDSIDGEIEEISDMDEMEEIEMKQLDSTMALDDMEVIDVEEEKPAASTDVEDMDLVGEISEIETEPFDATVSVDNLFEDVNDFFIDTPAAPVHSPEEMFDITEDISSNFFAVKPVEESAASMGQDLQNETIDDDDAAANFTTGLPFFGNLTDDSGNESMPRASLLARAIELAANAQTTPKNVEKAQEENPEAIKIDNEGVFSINGNLETKGVVQDNSFKRLVDSVLNN